MAQRFKRNLLRAVYRRRTLKAARADVTASAAAKVVRDGRHGAKAVVAEGPEGAAQSSMPAPANGHNYIDHNYIGHDYIGHNYIGHNYTGHNYIGTVVDAGSSERRWRNH